MPVSDRERPDDVVEEIDGGDEVEQIVEELAEHPDVPEADVIEQHQTVAPETPREVHLRPDVPEADALEQAIPVDDDEEFIDE
jgi:hypothetical protein